jgi:hypothetical protein
MPYRSPDPHRIQRQMTENHFAHVGQVVTWRQYISASANAAVAGFDATPYYREQTITALFARGHDLPEIPEIQTPAGTIESGTFLAVTRQPLGLRDELVWNGDTYRVESESIEAKIAGNYISRVKRGML